MKKVVLFGFILSLSIAQAQDEPFDTIFGASEPKRTQFGFNLGLNYSNLIDNPVLTESAFISNGLGIRLGLLADIRLTNWLYTSPKAEMAFNNSKVVFNQNDGSQSVYDVFPVSLEFMNHFTLKNARMKHKPYFYAGPNFRLSLDKPDTPIEFATRPDLAIDFGIGIDTQIKYFNFAPELRYSFGLLNVNSNPQIQSLNFHNISLVLNFKG